MKKIILSGLMVVSVLLGSAQTNIVGSYKATDAATAKKNLDIVNRYLDAFHKGDVTTMDNLLAQDFMQYGLGIKDSTNKSVTLEGVRKHWEVYKYGGKRYNRIHSVALTTTQDAGRGRGKGDWVYEWGDVETDYPASPDYGGKAITAKFAYHAVFRVKNGKINSCTIYFNHEDIMRQLGYKMISVAEQQKPEAANLKIK
ncbi:MAG: nuclear transport factor 2 family protein [Flavipsychrobacter sp.]|nr:nuclear transport factor 2 family protein [Flavipsychrobacter sp.]